MSDFQDILQGYQTQATSAKKRKLDGDGDGPLKHHALARVGGDKSGGAGRAPEFLILGAQKAGTMAAVKNLNKHPDISVLSEVHYFDRHWNNKDPQWYLDQFDASKAIRGEKTPELIYVEECFERIKSVSPAAKFLLFIREPISRAYSSWNMNTSKNRESVPFDECVQRNINNLNEIRSYGTGEFHYVQRGFYMDQIERFLKVFPNRDNLLIVVAERIRANPKQEYDRIFQFLGAKSIDFEAEDDHMGSYTAPIGARVAERLRKLYAPHNERLFQYLGYRIDEWDNPDGDKPQPPPIAAPEPVSPTSTGIGSGIHATDTAASSKLHRSSSSGTSGSGNGELTGSSESTGSSANKLPGKTSSNSRNSSSNSSSQKAVIEQVKFHDTTKDGSFADIGRRHKTDKITHHGYHRFYPRYIESYRAVRGGAMLEIGVDRSHSLHTWLEYYPHAFIYGVDIDISSSGDRYKIFKADQSNMSEMRRIMNVQIKHPLFLILDDGSHIPEHQVMCFDSLFATLLPGGCYIVEDIETSYWSRNGLYGYTTRYGYHHEKSAIEVFKDLLDDVNEEFLHDGNRRAQEQRVGREVSLKTRKMISSISFGQNCIIIMKKTDEEMLYNDRPYRFRKNL